MPPPSLLTYLTIPFLPFPSSKHTHVFLQFVDTLIINIWVCWALQRGPSGIWLQQYVNHEIPDVQTGFRKARGTRDQIENINCIIEKARELQKNTYFCFIDSAKAFDCVDHNKLWKILKEMAIPDHLTCLLKNLYAGQEARVRTGHGATDWFQIG